MEIKISKHAGSKSEVYLMLESKKTKIPDFTGKKGEIIVLYDKNNPRVYVGLGKREDLNIEIIRQTVANSVRKIKALKRKDFSLMVPELKKIDILELVYAMCEASLLADYSFDKYKTNTEEKHKIKLMELVLENIEYSEEVKLHEAIVISRAVNRTRNLVNENADLMTPAGLALKAKKLAKTKTVKITVLDEKQIKKQGLELLYTVGKGSKYPSRLIIAEYNGGKKDDKKIAIIGKGVTFDTGGLNLKPTGHIETMRTDMSGAAVTLGIIQAASKLKLPVNLVCVIGCACNAVGPGSYFPGDVYKSYLGKTVQIKNTDAEGRLVMADALAYAVKKHKPDYIVDFATLTGAIVVTLGHLAAGLFSNNDELSEKLCKAGAKVNERLVRIPVYEECKEALKGEIADLNNISNFSRGEAGSMTAAAFLQEFVEDIPWAHIDIAGVSFNTKGNSGYVPKFATGYGVRLGVEWLRSMVE
jgi:leucyl aminopeptidase